MDLLDLYWLLTGAQDAGSGFDDSGDRRRRRGRRGYWTVLKGLLPGFRVAGAEAHKLPSPLASAQAILHGMEPMLTWMKLPADEAVMLQITWSAGGVPMRLGLGDTTGFLHDELMAGGTHVMAFIPHAAKICVRITAGEAGAPPISVQVTARPVPAGALGAPTVADAA